MEIIKKTVTKVLCPKIVRIFYIFCGKNFALITIDVHEDGDSDEFMCIPLVFVSIADIASICEC